MKNKAICGYRVSVKSGLVGLALATLFLLVSQAFPAEQKPQSAPSNAAPGSVTFRDGRLTVETRGESLADLLAEVQQKSGIKFHVRKTLPADAVTASFRDVPVETAIQRLLGRDFDLVWFYTAPKTGKGSPEPTEVWVVGRGERVGGATADAGKGAARRQAKAGDSSALKERLMQIEDLADEDPAKAVPLLLGALNDQDPRIRSAAAEALGEVGDPSAIEALGNALAKDSDSDVRESAAEALGELGSPNAVQVLRTGLKDGDEDVREAVVDALAAIGGPEAERVLRQALADSDEDVRDAAVAALAKLKQTKKK
jgi:hypothetical protein